MKAEIGTWVGGSESHAAAAVVSPSQLDGLLRNGHPFTVPNGFLSPLRRMKDTSETFVVRSSQDLARFQQRIRDQLIAVLMENGATFLLPETVMVDVDVSIGPDTVVYPGVVLEGKTTLGVATVIGPGCRLIDSGVGSGVEMKGWNYVAHTEVRHRAILEPYVRRGFN
jgi:bifunctional N-acetylglucosamine-1-phosphate-uridyltransferase/glucosamine-1-phosphate-acetyltransferase GlmU-like protein